jgi:hypothetical protein
MMAAALLASLEFGYAHLRQVGLWPLELIASSIWRLLQEHLTAAGPGNKLWVMPLGVVMAGLLVEVVGIWRERRQSWRETADGDDHE